jgi:hypothetical protein
VGQAVPPANRAMQRLFQQRVRVWAWPPVARLRRIRGNKTKQAHIEVKTRTQSADH